MKDIRRRLIVAFGLFGGLSAAKTALAQPNDMAAFRAEVLGILRQRFPALSAEPGEREGAIRVGSLIVNLENLHAKVGQLPFEKKEAAIVEFLERVAETLEKTRAAKVLAWSEARILIRPRLLPVEYMKADLPIVHRQFAADVILAYAIDYGQTVGFVDPKTFERWGIATDLLHETAIANLEGLSTQVAIEVLNTPGAAGRLAAVATNDTYDAARLALPGFRARLMQTLGDVVYVGIPNRDFLVAWSADFSRSANVLAQIEKDARQQPYPLTNTIFVVSHGGVRPATPSDRIGR